MKRAPLSLFFCSLTKYDVFLFHLICCVLEHVVSLIKLVNRIRDITYVETECAVCSEKWCKIIQKICHLLTCFVNETLEKMVWLRLECKNNNNLSYSSEHSDKSCFVFNEYVQITFWVKLNLVSKILHDTNKWKRKFIIVCMNVKNIVS